MSKANQAAIEYEIKAMEAKRRYVEAFDQWKLWTSDDDKRLEQLRKRLENEEI